MLPKPEKDEIKTAIEVVEWLREKTETDEPYAEAFIESCGELIGALEEAIEPW